jgi:hypothetical protein
MSTMRLYRTASDRRLATNPIWHPARRVPVTTAEPRRTTAVLETSVGARHGVGLPRYLEFAASVGVLTGVSSQRPWSRCCNSICLPALTSWRQTCTPCAPPAPTLTTTLITELLTNPLAQSGSTEDPGDQSTRSGPVHHTGQLSMAWKRSGFESPKLHSLFLLIRLESHRRHFSARHGSRWTRGQSGGLAGRVQLTKAYDSGSWVFCRRRS